MSVILVVIAGVTILVPYLYVKPLQLSEVEKCQDRQPVDEMDGLVQERRNPSANALELLLSCTKPSKCLVTQSSNE